MRHTVRNLQNIMQHTHSNNIMQRCILTGIQCELYPSLENNPQSRGGQDSER